MPLFRKKSKKTKADLEKVEKRRKAALAAKTKGIQVKKRSVSGPKGTNLVSLTTAQAKVKKDLVQARKRKVQGRAGPGVNVVTMYRPKAKSNEWATWSSSG